MYYFKCSALSIRWKERKKTLSPLLILVHILDHIVIADAFHFLYHSWERCFLNLCAHQKYANFMYSVLMSY